MPAAVEETAGVTRYVVTNIVTAVVMADGANEVARAFRTIVMVGERARGPSHAATQSVYKRTAARCVRAAYTQAARRRARAYARVGKKHA